MERLPLEGFFDGVAKHIDMPDQQVIRAALQEINNKEKKSLRACGNGDNRAWLNLDSQGVLF